MGMFSTIGASMAGRAGVGAIAGGGLGYLNTGDIGGVIGGAAAGAGMGAGLPWMRGQAGRLGTISGRIGQGLGGMNRGARAMSNYGAGLARGTGITSNLGFGMLRGGITAQRGLSAASGFIGNNAVAVNKWGGRGLAAAGFGSAAYMGSSMIGSNRGY
jgi:hypothetical protein